MQDKEKQLLKLKNDLYNLEMVANKIKIKNNVKELINKSIKDINQAILNKLNYIYQFDKESLVKIILSKKDTVKDLEIINKIVSSQKSYHRIFYKLKIYNNKLSFLLLDIKNSDCIIEYDIKSKVYMNDINMEYDLCFKTDILYKMLNVYEYDDFIINIVNNTDNETNTNSPLLVEIPTDIYGKGKWTLYNDCDIVDDFDTIKIDKNYKLTDILNDKNPKTIININENDFFDYFNILKILDYHSEKYKSVYLYLNINNENKLLFIYSDLKSIFIFNTNITIDNNNDLHNFLECNLYNSIKAFNLIKNKKKFSDNFNIEFYDNYFKFTFDNSIDKSNFINIIPTFFEKITDYNSNINKFIEDKYQDIFEVEYNSFKKAIKIIKALKKYKDIDAQVFIKFSETNIEIYKSNYIDNNNYEKQQSIDKEDIGKLLYKFKDKDINIFKDIKSLTDKDFYILIFNSYLEIFLELDIDIITFAFKYDKSGKFYLKIYNKNDLMQEAYSLIIPVYTT